MRRTRIILTLVPISVVLSATVGWAFWTSAGTGAASATTGTLAAASITDANPSSSSVSLTWSSVTAPGAGTVKYYVTRDSAVVGGACGTVSTPISGTSCTDTGVSDGSHAYRVVAVWNSWTSTSSVANVTTGTAPDAPTSVALHNGGGTGSVYINSANAGSLSVDVVTPTTSVPTATVHLRLTDAVSQVVTPTPVTAPSGAQTVTFSGINASSLDDGAITVEAWVSNTFGSSPNTTITPTKDIVAPFAPASVSLTNGLGTGNAFINNANKAGLTYSVVLPSSGNLSSDTVEVALTSGATVTGTASGSGTNGATVAVSAINASSLTDGGVAVSATITDTAGNVSAAKTATTTKDVIAPSAATNSSLTNGLGSGNAFINSVNQSSLNYNAVLGATNNSATDTVTIAVRRGSQQAQVTVTSSGINGGTVHAMGINVGPTGGNLPDGGTFSFVTIVDLAGNSSVSGNFFNATKDTAAPAAPASVSLTNGGGTGNAFINNANRASVNYGVVLGASGNTTNDSVRVSLASGVTVTGTVGSSGVNGGTVTVSAINATALTDGIVAATATLTDQAGNPSTAVTNANTKDVVGPAVTITSPASGATNIPRSSTPYAGATGTATRDIATVTLNIYNGTATSGTVVQSPTVTVSDATWSATGGSGGGQLSNNSQYTAVAVQSDTAGNSTTVTSTFRT